MDTFQFDIPVVAVVFNRPDCAQQLMAAIRGQRPATLFVISDGPRLGREKETQLVEECRVLMTPDWDCEFIPIFSAENMGCRRRISSGLEEVFSKVESAIILEDDCLPAEAFFSYCREQLLRFAVDDRVTSVCGYRTFPEKLSPSDQICFSSYSNSWGWATWARAWSFNQKDLNALLDHQMDKRLSSIFGQWRAARYWHFIFRRVKAGKNDSWAYIWMLSQWMQGGLTVYPGRNLVKNTGGDTRATHTRGLPFYLRRKVTEEPCWVPGRELFANRRVDKWLDDFVYSKSLFGRLIWIADVITRRFV